MTKSLTFLSVGMFCVGCSSFIINGLLPQIGQTIGQPVQITGQGITAFSLAYLLSAPLFSMIFVNKPVGYIAKFALVVFLTGNLVTAMSENILVFIIGRVITGIGAGIFTPICVTIAISSVNPSMKGRTLSLIWGTNSAGVVFGVPLGLQVSSLFNWKWSILSIVVLVLISLIGFSLQKININLPAPSTLRDRLSLLSNRNILSVLGVTCFTCMASLGLYSYVTTIYSGVDPSLTIVMFAWGIGGFIGSSFIGTIVDRTRNPQAVMAFIIAGLVITFFTIPIIKNSSYLSLIPFFMWGALGWATTTPQQHILFGLKRNEGTVLVAFNASAIGLGGVLGTAIGGGALSSGMSAQNLPILAGVILIFVFIYQLSFVQRLNKECKA